MPRTPKFDRYPMPRTLMRSPRAKWWRSFTHTPGSEDSTSSSEVAGVRATSAELRVRVVTENGAEAAVSPARMASTVTSGSRTVSETVVSGV